MRADERFPGGRLLTLGRWWQTTALENVPNRLITDVVPQMRQGTGQAIIAPAAIFLRHAHHQVLKFFIDAGATQGLALGGAIKLLGHQLAMPAQNGVGCGDFGDLLQRPLPQFLAEFGQSCAFGIAQV